MDKTLADKTKQTHYLDKWFTKKFRYLSLNEELSETQPVRLLGYPLVEVTFSHTEDGLICAALLLSLIKDGLQAMIDWVIDIAKSKDDERDFETSLTASLRIDTRTQ